MDEERRTKVAIVGFAPSWNQAPFADESYEIWGLNELYKLFQKHPGTRADRWFEIHSRQSPSKNKPEHIGWLKSAPIPIYMWEEYEDIPNSVKFPKDDIVKWLEDQGYYGAKYFTNSISWMIAYALYEGFEEIAIYGVDMAQDSEYQHQRPSCEYIIGICEGRGVKVTIPADSDLLKTGLLYGFETDNSMRIKMKSRMKELEGRKKGLLQQKLQLQQQLQQMEFGLQQIAGAQEDIKYWLTNWTV